MAEIQPAVEIRNLVKDFKTSFRRKPLRAVDGVSLRIMPGEVYGLIGPNGSGKSTTMKALLGLVAPTSGDCAIFGRDSLKVDSRHDVGFLPENPYFYKHLSGEETLRFYGRLCGLGGKALDQRIDELLELVDLRSAKDRRLGGYSKGMLQRIGLAQALIQEPRLVVLDEPTAGVDPVGSRQIRFVDSNGVLINSITEAPAPAPAASDNPLRGEAIPKLGENFGDAKSDNISEINFLKGQIEALRRQVNRLTDRINAAAAK